MNTLEQYTAVARKASSAVTRSYSTSFSIGVRSLHPRFRDPIHAIYGFVRLADEIVDTFHGFDKRSLFDRFSTDTWKAIDEGISLNFGSKLPGPTTAIHPVNMEFRYGTSFGTEPPEAYERLLLDCMLGDASLFTRGDEVEASWTWISKIHQRWKAAGTDVARYEAGTWGPAEAEALLMRDGRSWRRP